MYSNVIEVADSESDLGFFSTALVSEIFAFYHLLEYARGRPGRRGHVHLSHNFYIQIFFQNFFVYYLHEGYEGVCRVLTFEGVCRVYTLRVYVGMYSIYFKGVCSVFTMRLYINRCIFSNSSARKVAKLENVCNS